MLVYGRNVAERIFSDEKLLKKVRKLKIEEKYYLKIKNLLGEFPKSKIKLVQKSYNHRYGGLPIYSFK